MSQQLLETFLPENFEHKIDKFTPLSEDGSKFYAVLRVNIQTADDAKKWKEQFESLSGNNWIVEQTHPNLVRLQFKKEFKCRRSTRNKVNRKNDNRRSSVILNASCPSRLVITIKLDTPATRKADHLVREGFLGVIKITWSHSHSVGAENVDSLTKLNISKKTEEAFLSYFEAGNTPSEAKYYHQEVLASQSDFNAAITLANSSINPKDHVIHYLYGKWRKQTQGERSGADMIKKLREKMEELQEKGVKIAMTEEPFCIAIVTPIANRTHMHHPMTKYIAFVDSTSSCDLDSNCVTFLFTPSAAGALPLGVVISKSQGQEAYATGFKLLRQLLGNNSFGGQGFPSVFMTDDSNAERGGLHEAWPEACQLLCQFHGANAMWKWLWLGTHQINNKDRQPLVQLYRAIMYAIDDESAWAAYNEAISTATEMQYPQYCRHLDSLWESIDTVTQQPKRLLWVSAYRKGATLGNNTNNYAEANIRVFKEIVLHRLKAFSPVSLALFVSGQMEFYYERRLLEFANGRKPAQQTLLDSLKEKAVYLDNINQISRHSEVLFGVPSSNGNDSYEVNIAQPSCTCPVGFTGAICKHQYAVSTLFGISLITVPQVLPAHCSAMAFIALGDKAPDPDFYEADCMDVENGNALPLNDNVELPVAPTETAPKPWFDREKVLEDRNLLITKFTEAIHSLPIDNENAHAAVNKLTRSLTNSTPNQVVSIIRAATSEGHYTHSTRRKMRVNEPATSRRRAELGRGGDPVKQGRPSAKGGAVHSLKGRPAKLGKKKPLKLSNNLGGNISKNRRNAKSH